MTVAELKEKLSHFDDNEEILFYYLKDNELWIDHTLIETMLFSLIGLQIKCDYKFICVVLIISNYKWAFV